MKNDFKGYRIEICSGNRNCRNRITAEDTLLRRIEGLFAEEDLAGFIKQRINGDIRFHLEFRVSIADCPNACSRPQIVDIGIISAEVPQAAGNNCTLCGACVNSCRENAVMPDEKSRAPLLDYNSCLYCGSCIKACPAGALIPIKTGYRVLLGGRLGRHPRLAMDLGGVFSADQVIEIIRASLDLYKKNGINGERFSAVMDDRTIEHFRSIYSQA